MSATVTLPNRETVEYPNATNASVSNGHLFLTAGFGPGARTVAVYAPERWASVDVKD